MIVTSLINLITIIYNIHIYYKNKNVNRHIYTIRGHITHSSFNIQPMYKKLYQITYEQDLGTSNIRNFTMYKINNISHLTHHENTSLDSSGYTYLMTQSMSSNNQVVTRMNPIAKYNLYTLIIDINNKQYENILSKNIIRNINTKLRNLIINELISNNI